MDPFPYLSLWGGSKNPGLENNNKHRLWASVTVRCKLQLMIINWLVWYGNEAASNWWLCVPTKQGLQCTDRYISFLFSFIFLSCIFYPPQCSISKSPLLGAYNLFSWFYEPFHIQMFFKRLSKTSQHILRKVYRS